MECDKDRCPISKGYAESTDCCMGSCDETKHTCLVKATPGTDGQGICTFDKVRSQSLYFIEGRSAFSIKTQTEFFHLASGVMEQFSERSAPLMNR